MTAILTVQNVEKAFGARHVLAGVSLAVHEEDRIGLVVVGVDVGEDAADVAPFVNDVGVRYPIFLDHDFTLADAVGAKRVPALLVVGADGRILHRAHELDAATRAAVEAALAPPAAKR